MIISNHTVMGRVPGADWSEVEIPYLINRNEQELEFGDERTIMPCWAIWDWLEGHVPDLHRQDEHGKDNGPVSWMVLRKIDIFSFNFEDRILAMKFKLLFGGDQNNV